MKYKVQNDNLDELFLTAEYKFKPDATVYDPDFSTFKKYSQFGVVDQGDGKQSDRKLSGKLDINVTDDVQYLDKLNKLASFFDNRKAPFYLIDTDNGRRSKVRLGKINNKFMEGNEYRNSIDIGIEFVLLDASTEDEIETSVSATLANNGIFSIVLPYNTIECYPIVEISNNDPVNLDDFTLEVTNNGITNLIRIKEPNFIQSTIIKIDCIRGNVTYGAFNINTKVASGSFFPLYSGSNQIKYSSLTANGVSLQVTYRKRFIY